MIKSENACIQSAADLELNADGTISVNPLTGWALVSFANMMGILRIEFATDPSFKEINFVQLAVTPEQIRDLGNTLIRKADEIESAAAHSVKSSIGN
jgi:hypothetical protein